MARPLDVQPKTYDEAKLATMAPPFTVRIEKIKGNTRSPIPLPEGEDGTPGGTGWGVDEVRQLEQWLVTEWAGGGLYGVSVTDSQNQTMKWQPFWDPKQFPERTPPTLADAAGVGAAPPPGPSNVVSFPYTAQPPPSQLPSLQQQQAGRYMSSPFSNGLPPGGGFFQPQQYGQMYPTAPMPNPPMPGTQQWDAYQREVERRERENRDRERDAELRREREKNERIEREAVAAKHQADLERERQAALAAQNANKQEMSELRSMIAQLAASIKEGASSSKPNAEIETLKEMHRQAEAKAERERLERDAERRDTMMREQMRAMQDSTKQQIDMLQRQSEDRARALETAMAAARENRPDQMLTLWQSSQREQMELSKELSRNQLSQMQALQGYMMNPRDMMNMAKEASQSVDQATERVTRFFGSVIDTQQKVTENLLQMQPGSNGVVELVGSSLDRVGSLAERYLGGKQLEAQLTQQGQVQIAEANARAYAAAVQAQAQAAQPQPAPQPQSQGAGLGGIPMQAQPRPRQPVKSSEVPNAISQTQPIKRLGKTDQEWFGVLMPQVAELRTNAHRYIESLKMTPPRLNKQGDPDGMNPESAAQVIGQAVGVVTQRQIMITAMQELLFQDRFADFIDVLLPDPIVTQPYRDDVVQSLVRLAKIASGIDPDAPIMDASQGQAIEVVEQGDDDADDDDGSDDDDDTSDTDEPNSDRGQDGKVVPLTAVAGPSGETRVNQTSSVKPKPPVRRA